MLERGFLIFFEFFCYFFRNFLARVEYERNLGQIFFFSFLASLYPYWIEIMPELSFLIFFIVLLFFSEFSCLGQVWTEFGTKFFFSPSCPISSVLAKNSNRKRFFYFLNFFAIFFRIFFPRPSRNENRDKIFFFLFFGLSTPLLAKSNSGKRFFNFLNFFAIFFGIFLPGSSMNGIWDQNFFFSLSRPI